MPLNPRSCSPRYRPRHRRPPNVTQRLLPRAVAIVAIVGGMLNAPLATGSAGASGGDCVTATAPGATLTCVEQVFTVAVDVAKMAQQAAGGVSVPVPTIVDQNSLLSLVDQTTAQAVQAAEDCLNQTNPLCAPIVDRNSLLSLVDQVAAEAVQQAGNCVTQTDPTCALIVQTANQEAQAIETLATTCVSGTDTVCAQLELLGTSEISALLTLASGCVSGSNPACNGLLGTVSQLVGEAVTCAVGPISPTAPSTLPNPLVIDTGSGGGSGTPDVGVTCQQVKDAAAQLVAGCQSGATAGCDSAITEVDKSPCLNSSDQVACAQASAAPGEVIPPDVDPETLFPANQLTGTVDTGAGVGVPGLEVDFYVDPAGSDSFSATPDSLGSTTTDGNGNYTFTLPSTLDAFATSQANANGGHLPVTIATSAYLTIPGTQSVALAIAEGTTSVLIGGSADYFDSLPPTLTLYPAQSVDIAANAPSLPTPDVTDPSVAGESHYQGTLGSGGTVTTVNGVVSNFNPFLINGVDFTNAVAVAPGSPDINQPPPPDPPDNVTCTKDDGRALFVNQSRVKHNEQAYVLVGEIHAYADQHAGFTYGTTSDTTTQVGLSVDGEHWSVEGSRNTHNTHSTDWHYLDAGPYFGKQMRMKFDFDELKQEWTCQYNRDKTYYAYVEEAVANTWEGATGADVSRYDGPNAYAGANSHYVYIVAPHSGIDVSKGKGYGYSGAFSIEGFSAGAETMHDKTITITQDAGDDHFEHDTWGNNKYVPNGPQIIYSY